MKPLYRILLSIALLAPLLLASPQTGQANSAGTLRLRVGVTVDGLYHITPSDLSDAGVEVTTIDPRTFAMASQGEDIAIRVIGEADGHFGGNDFIEFFGEKFHSSIQDEKYSDENVYWLEIGGAPGPRIPNIDAHPTNDLTPPADYPAVVRAEENKYWYSLHTIVPQTKDTWFWDELRPTSSSQVIRDYPYNTPYPVAGAEATLWVDQNAKTYYSHHTEISIDGVKLVDADWRGKARSYVSAPLPAGMIGSDTTTVTIKATTSNSSDLLYFNYWELHYRRLFRAWENRFDFRSEEAGPHEYQIDGWTTSEVEIWDIADPRTPERLVGAMPEPGQMGKALRFRVSDQADDRFWLQSVPTIFTPDTMRIHQETGLRTPSRGADAVIVTTSELRPAAEKLAIWHESQGRRAMVVDFQDAVDEFNDGIYHPRAIPAMLSWSQGHWPGQAPEYLTLVGDGHWNFKNFNPDRYTPLPNHIPPYLAWVDPNQGEVPADSWYGDLDGDRMPDIMVGRLAVNTLPEAFVVVNKIVNYQSNLSGDWHKRALFVADNNDSSGSYTTLSDAIIDDYLPAKFTPQRVYFLETHPDAASAKEGIRDAINNGTWMVQFAGHGAPYRWTHEKIWTLDDIDSLTNGDQLPIVMTFNCLDGYFAYPDPDLFAIAEVMQRHPDGGSVAAISPSGLGYTYDQNQFRQMMMQAIFEDEAPELGLAFRQAQQAFYDWRGTHYLIDTMMLYGDPAMRFPQVQQLKLFLPTILQ